MQTDQNFLKYFPEAELQEKNDRTLRSSCLRIGDCKQPGAGKREI